MKKIFFYLFIVCTLFFSINIVSAKTIGSVACEYDVYDVSDEYMTTIQVHITDYNDGSAGTVVSMYKMSDDKYYYYEGPTYYWKNFGNINFTGMLRLFTTDKKGKTFLKNYNTSSKCPNLYSNRGDSAIDVENHALYDTIGDYKLLKPKQEYLKEPGGSWVTREEFFKNDSGNTSEKPDLVCSYKMNFDMHRLETSVEFRTIYNPTNGSKSYLVSVNGNGQPFSTLNEDIYLMLGQGVTSSVYVSSAELKNIFKDECLPGNKVYHYYDMSYNRYTITTDQKEASENGAGGRYDNGDGSNDGAGGNKDGSSGNSGSGASTPDLNFNESQMSCDALLGNNMIKVIKTAITLIRIGATIATIVIGMTTFLPALTKGDAGAFNAAIKKCIWLAVVLMLIILLPVLLRTIGNLFNWDLCGLV